MSNSFALLGDIVTIDRKGVSPEKIGDNTSFVGLEHINSEDGSINFEKVDNGDIASTKFEFSHKHVLYGKLRPYLRKIARPNIAGICSTDILPLLPGPLVYRDYLYHYLRTPDMVSLATTRSSGANLPRLSPTALSEFTIPLPPLEEQKRIAAILDKADELRRKRREAIAKLDSLLQSVFLEMFGDPVTNPKGWNVVPLNEACEGKYGIKAGPFGSSLKKEDYVSAGYRVYGQEQVIRGDFRYGDYYIDKDKFLDLKSCEVKPGDVLMSLVGTIGRVVVVPEGVEQGIINPRLLKITPQNNLLNPTFLANMLALPSLQKKLSEESHGGTMNILNAGIVKNIRIPLPTFEAQLTFEERVISITALQEQSQWSQKKENKLFASLQQNVFLTKAY